MAYDTLFKSAEHASQYLSAYNAVLDLWHTPHETLDVETSFGTTHINVAGSSDLPPLILLHGAAVNSTMWYANVAALTPHFRIYAPDIINQTGLSVATRLPKTADECADWLKEIFDALNIKSAVIIGHSYGGWLTLKMAMRYPQCVERMVLLAPAPAFAAQSKQLIFRMLAVLVRPVKSTFYWFFQWMTTMPLGNDHIFIEQLITGMKSFKPEKMTMAVMSVYKDEELKAIEIPTLLLIGESEVVYKPQKVLERAERLLPHIQSELIPNASHLLPIEQAEIVNEKMLNFLTT